MDVRAIIGDIEKKLLKLEEEIRKRIHSEVEAISLMGEHIYLTRGKRVRPILLLLSSRLCGYKGENDVFYAMIVELIHNATLIHDDVIDNSSTRRGKPSVNSQWGNTLTVLLGDYLYIEAMDLALRDQRIDIMQILSSTTKKMIEGELMQNTRLADVNLTEDDYLDIIRRKTAYLFSACSSIGAMLANSSEEEKKALSQFAFYLGIAFQLVDDVLNFTSAEEVLGKPVGNDLLEGKLTLPVILLLKQENTEERIKVENVLKEKSYDSVKREEIIALLNKYKALEESKKRAAFYTEKAKKNLDCFSPSQPRESLMLLADFIIQREK